MISSSTSSFNTLDLDRSLILSPLLVSTMKISTFEGAKSAALMEAYPRTLSYIGEYILQCGLATMVESFN